MKFPFKHNNRRYKLFVFVVIIVTVFITIVYNFLFKISTIEKGQVATNMKKATNIKTNQNDTRTSVNDSGIMQSSMPSSSARDLGEPGRPA